MSKDPTPPPMLTVEAAANGPVIVVAVAAVAQAVPVPYSRVDVPPTEFSHKAQIYTDPLVVALLMMRVVPAVAAEIG